MEYHSIKECFVAFIDILGFKEMIKDDNGTGKSLSLIIKATQNGTNELFNRKQQANHPYKYWYSEFKVQSFSDCFCFSIPLEFTGGEKDYKQNFVSFYGWLSVFFTELQAEGILCRGGISQGWHYSEKSIIFSQALIDAYETESKRALHPIVKRKFL